MRTLTPERQRLKQQALRLAARGQSGAAIARRLALPRSVIHYWLSNNASKYDGVNVGRNVGQNEAEKTAQADAERRRRDVIEEHEQRIRASTRLAGMVQYFAEVHKFPLGRASIREMFEQQLAEVNFQVNSETLKIASANLAMFLEEWNDDYYSSATYVW